jgi:hypothetical protein
MLMLEGNEFSHDLNEPIRRVAHDTMTSAREALEIRTRQPAARQNPQEPPIRLLSTPIDILGTSRTAIWNDGLRDIRIPPAGAQHRTHINKETRGWFELKSN